MKRHTLWLAAGQLLCLAAIGWLWGENRSMREQVQAAGGANERRSVESAAIPLGKTDNARNGASISKNGNSRKSRPTPGPAVITPPDRTTPVAAPGDSTSDESDTTEGEPRTANEVAGSRVQTTYIHPIVGAVTAGYAGSSLKNGGFEEGLEPWTCEKGKVVSDPEQGQNSVLEIGLDEEGFLLSQPFRWPAGHKELTLAFRVKAAEGTRGASTRIGVELLCKDGKALPQHISSYELTEKWTVMTLRLTRSYAFRDPALTIAIKGTEGKGRMWIDDMILK